MISPIPNGIFIRKIVEGVEFTEASNTPTPGGKVVNFSYILILRTGEMKKPVRSGKTFRFA